MSLSFAGTCSLAVKSEVIQNNRAPPATRNETMSSPVMPCVIASFPRGAISPQNAHAKKQQTWAINGRLLFIFLLILLNATAKVVILKNISYLCIVFLWMKNFKYNVLCRSMQNISGR